MGSVKPKQAASIKGQFQCRSVFWDCDGHCDTILSCVVVCFGIALVEHRLNLQNHDSIYQEPSMVKVIQTKVSIECNVCDRK